MANLAALKAAIESTPELLAAAASGSNSNLLALLNADHPTATTFDPVPRAVLLEAVGDALRGLTGDALNRLRILTAGESVDLSRPNTRAELNEIFTGNTAVLARLRDAARRKQTVAEQAGIGAVSLSDLWKVLPQIPSSHHAKYLAGTV